MTTLIRLRHVENMFLERMEKVEDVKMRCLESTHYFQLKLFLSSYKTTQAGPIGP